MVVHCIDALAHCTDAFVPIASNALRPPCSRQPPLQVLHDAFEGMNGLGEALHGRIRIQFVDVHGLEEAGGGRRRHLQGIRNDGGWVV
jgi:hypothetical protein